MSYTFFAPRMQIFTFPPDIMNRLWKKPSSSKAALKLYQTCKYFYYKQNAVFFDKIFYSSGNLRIESMLSDPLNLNDYILCFVKELIIGSSILEKNAKMSRFHNIICLRLHRTKLKIEDFEILTSNNCIEKFEFCDSILTYSDGTLVTIDAVLEKLPCVKYFEYDNVKDCFSAETLENLSTIKLCHKLKLFHIKIHEISATCNPNLLCKFIENNMCHSGTIHITGWDIDEINGKLLVEEIKKVWDSWEDKGYLSCLRTSRTFSNL